MCKVDRFWPLKKSCESDPSKEGRSKPGNMDKVGEKGSESLDGVKDQRRI